MHIGLGFITIMANMIAHTLNPLIDGHSDKLAIFQTLPMDTGIESVHQMQFGAANTSNLNSSCVEIVIDSNGRYLDLGTAQLFMELSLVHQDDTHLAPGESATVVNNIVHSLWGQIDAQMNRTTVSKFAAPDYAYKAYIDTLIASGEQSTSSWLHTSGWVRDTAHAFDVCTLANADNVGRDDTAGTNDGFNARCAMTAESRTFQVEGGLHVDCFKSGRYLLDSVKLTLRFWKNPPEFYVVSSVKDKSYKLKISQMLVKMDAIALSSSMLIAHANTLADSKAIYPYMKTIFKSVTIPKGNRTFEAPNLFDGIIPSKMIFALVTSDAYVGQYGSNPFHFQNCLVNKIDLRINGFSWPNGSSQAPKFDDSNYTECFNLLFQSLGQYYSNNSCEISYDDYGHGFTMFVYDSDRYFPGIATLASHSRVSLPAPRLGSTSLTINFQQGLSEPMNLLIYAKCSDAFTVDLSRRVEI